MNGKYYPNPTFPSTDNESPAPVDHQILEKTKIESQAYQYPPFEDEPNVRTIFDGEINYIENILRLNKGKKVTVYATFPNSTEWKDKKFEGIVEEAGKDHIVLSDPNTGNWVLIPKEYLSYFDFNEKINYL